MRKAIIILVIICLFAPQALAWQFVALPDFLNRDVLTPKQTKHANATLDSIANFNPDLVLVPGDLVMAHWWWNGENVRKKSDEYYSKWKNRFNKRGLQYYTAVGDHELGDLPTVNWLLQSYLVPDFKTAYRKHFDYQDNGAKDLKDLTYYWLNKNALFITTYTFHYNGWFVTNKISETQLNWLQNTLRKYKNKVDHIIVQGHLPVLPVDGGYRSSYLTVKGGRNSRFWKIMSDNGVDYYIAGEFHTTSIKRKNGITQVVTGGMVGEQDIDYAVFSINNGIELKIKTVEK